MRGMEVSYVCARARTPPQRCMKYVCIFRRRACSARHRSASVFVLSLAVNRAAAAGTASVGGWHVASCN